MLGMVGIPPDLGELFALMCLICLWSGKPYKKACAPKKSRTIRVTTRLLSTSSTQQELLR